MGLEIFRHERPEISNVNLDMVIISSSHTPYTNDDITNPRIAENLTEKDITYEKQSSGKFDTNTV